MVPWKVSYCKAPSGSTNTLAGRFDVITLPLSCNQAPPFLFLFFRVGRSLRPSRDGALSPPAATVQRPLFSEVLSFNRCVDLLFRRAGVLPISRRLDSGCLLPSLLVRFTNHRPPSENLPDLIPSRAFFGKEGPMGRTFLFYEELSE